ncbi:MAG TPA: hypothetical protein VFN65_15205 [Solirubrobacteraceae bacterium]|nr:hypothetical protein [Solirubrobacteraceae bacterium]
MRCPLCELDASRAQIHVHLVDAHPDAVQTWSIGESRRRYRIACPLCEEAHEARVKPRSKDPAFLQTFAREIRMVAFDMLINHISVEHPELMTTERSDR